MRACLRRRRCLGAVACFLSAGLFGTVTHALGDSFTEDFSDDSPAPWMLLGPPYGAVTTDFSGSFTITSGEKKRIYLGTINAGYWRRNFIFEATVTVPLNGSAWGYPFFGMGSIVPVAGNYGEPSDPRLLMFANTKSTASQLQLKDNGATSSVYTGLGKLDEATHRMRMEWNAGSRIATFCFDRNNDGDGVVWDWKFTANGADNGFDVTNSQLLLGGGEGLSFDDIVVIALPEPTIVMVR